MTIGVIDECRRLGIGTKMLEHTINLVEREFDECILIYLHVISYNKSAIRFYLDNGFHKYELLKKHYCIDDVEYDAECLCRPIGSMKKQPILDNKTP